MRVGGGVGVGVGEWGESLVGMNEMDERAQPTDIQVVLGTEASANVLRLR